MSGKAGYAGVAPVVHVLLEEGASASGADNDFAEAEEGGPRERYLLSRHPARPPYYPPHCCRAAPVLLSHYEQLPWCLRFTLVTAPMGPLLWL